MGNDDSDDSHNDDFDDQAADYDQHGGNVDNAW